MQSDAEGAPTVVALGALTFQVIKRGERYAIRLKDMRSQQRAAFKGLEWFPVREDHRVHARFVSHPSPRSIPIVNVLGMVEPMRSPGYAEFRLKGRTLRLHPVLETSDATELFFIFKDQTSGRETYGAGRYLYAPMPSNGTVELDFNKAYSPPCAFTAFATCPLPPKENRLPIRIEAGERYRGHADPAAPAHSPDSKTRASR
jgi:uncharacterized protein (DUF1684 family)